VEGRENVTIFPDVNRDPGLQSAFAYGDAANLNADKCTCELHARVAGAVHRIATVVLRFFNLYGPRQDRQSTYSGVIALFADRLSRAEPIEIFGDREQVRDFTYIGDAARALGRSLSAASTRAPVFNVCICNGTTVRGLAEIMADLYRTELVAYYRPARGGEVRVSTEDPRRAAEQLGFRAGTSLAEGLAITLDVKVPIAEHERRLVKDPALSLLG
jgi:UDP-glucose 4-epimerase